MQNYARNLFFFKDIDVKQIKLHSKSLKRSQSYQHVMGMTIIKWTALE